MRKYFEKYKNKSLHLETWLPQFSSCGTKILLKAKEAKSAHETEQQRDIRERFFVWSRKPVLIPAKSLLGSSNLHLLVKVGHPYVSSNFPSKVVLRTLNIEIF